MSRRLVLVALNLLRLTLLTADERCPKHASWKISTELPLRIQPSTSESGLPEADEEESLPSEPDVGGDAALASQRTWLVEQCLAWGGEQRLRLRLTMAFLPGDERCRCMMFACTAVEPLPACCAAVWHIVLVSSCHKEQAPDYANVWMFAAGRRSGTHLALYRP